MGVAVLDLVGNTELASSHGPALIELPSGPCLLSGVGVSFRSRDAPIGVSARRNASNSVARVKPGLKKSKCTDRLANQLLRSDT